jgi:hypothetical protein
MLDKPDELCECGRMKVAIAWTTGSALDVVHGNYHWICKLCALEKQIAHAEERASALPQMRKDYEILKRALELINDGSST